MYASALKQRFLLPKISIVSNFGRVISSIFAGLAKIERVILWNTGNHMVAEEGKFCLLANSVGQTSFSYPSIILYQWDNHLLSIANILLFNTDYAFVPFSTMISLDPFQSYENRKA